MIAILRLAPVTNLLNLFQSLHQTNLPADSQSQPSPATLISGLRRRSECSFPLSLGPTACAEEPISWLDSSCNSPACAAALPANLTPGSALRLAPPSFALSPPHSSILPLALPDDASSKTPASASPLALQGLPQKSGLRFLSRARAPESSL